MRLRSGDPEAIGGYPLEARLGAGGMGTVYLARTASGRRVAIKLIHQQFADDEEFRTRFRQEVSAARRVSGAFTAAVVDADPEGALPWMATAYIEGPTLSERIESGGPLGGAELRALAVGLAEALRDIHRVGVVHRDLKPSNVVLSAEGPRVIDFGISRAADHQTLTMTGRVIGTPPFMSPEQLQAPRDVGPESDVFSLATLLVFAATGQGPFDADSPYITAYQVVHEEPKLSEVPAVLRALVEPCLAKDPGERPSTDELLARLLALPEDFGMAGFGTPAGAGAAVDSATQVLGGGARAEVRAGVRTEVPGPERAPREGADSGTGSRTLTGIGPGLRRRWRSVLAAAVAVTAVASGVTLLGPDRGADHGSDPQNAAQGEPPGPASTGKPLPEGFAPWQVSVRGGKDIPDELRCVPRGADVYCGGGGVVATRLRAADGKPLWTVRSPGVPANGMHFVGVAGTASGDTATSTAAGGNPEGSEGSGPTVVGYRIPDSAAPPQVVALTEDGEERWSAPLGGESTLLMGRTQSAVLHRGDVLSVDPGGSRIEARRAGGDGSVRWSRPFPSGTQCAPYAPGPRAARLYAICASTAEVDAVQIRRPILRLVDPADGRLGEPVPLKGPWRPVGEADGKLVLVQERMAGLDLAGYAAVAVFNPRTGKVSEHALRGADGDDVEVTDGAAPTVVAGALHFVEQNGRVHSVDPATGRVRWSRQTGVEWASAPVAAGGVLYFGSASGRVAALDVRDGDLVWASQPRVESPGSETGATARVSLAGRAVIVSAGGNTVFGFDAERPPVED
ncbi:protein kinase domain-containing protein [Streptomyces cavernicola]|uniref:Protein kinase n=1 Tax=Streptomyces cavernicola TaxID=3043613 RepID=A0ABT6SG08_9ACTN|nr:PQQ-binding-like beta-propeller repeat protein [Streptomyces sp. B-S-A6]MDI3406839.1 protein kinase [Streptomyces sp. B-S-A6]